MGPRASVPDGPDSVDVPDSRSRRDGLVIGGAILLVTAALGAVLMAAQLSGDGLPQNPIGAPAPDLQLPTLQGEDVVLSELSDGPLLVTFWASWCSTCTSDMPLLARLSREWADRGVQVVGIVMDDRHADAVAASTEHEHPYPSLFDGEGTAPRAYTVTGVPETFLIDADGAIAAKWFGPLPEHDVEFQLARAAS